MTPSGPCSLPPEALHARIGAWQALNGALAGAEPTASGALLHFRLDSAVVDTLLELIEAEHRCCPSLSFEATVTVRIEGPEGLRSWLSSTFVPSAADPKAVKEAVGAHYAAAAGRHLSDEPEAAAVGAVVYGPDAHEALPEQALRSSIGCANPVAVAELSAGETVLDLGSGWGVDVLLSARRVGPEGRAYGLDMTDEMRELARKNRADAGVDNAEFLRGAIDAIPLPDESVDVVLSNCVISLSPDKGAVFAEAYRVLRPGGRLAIADVVSEMEAAPELQADVESWISCVAGSLTRSQYRSALESAGFVQASIDESHPVAEGFASVIVRAAKPAG